jgi:hypothetical protein
MKKLSQLLLLAILIPCLSHGEGRERHSIDKSHSGIVDLSPELRELLSQEMRQLQNGMTEILPLYVSGKWAEIAPIASKMEASYILKQSLSEQQMHELHSRLPAAFIELDQQFHYLSGMLEHAATMEKAELVGFYFSKMSENCVNCHTQYATHRFPELAPKPRVHEH